MSAEDLKKYGEHFGRSTKHNQPPSASAGAPIQLHTAFQNSMGAIRMLFRCAARPFHELFALVYYHLFCLHPLDLCLLSGLLKRRAFSSTSTQCSFGSSLSLCSFLRCSTLLRLSISKLPQLINLQAELDLDRGVAPRPEAPRYEP
eukprot:COSAG03_NODE_5215_length_1311_cov_1.507426_1_plen_145_part_10